MPGITTWLAASTTGAAAAAGWAATSSGGPTAAIVPSTTSTEPGSCLTLRPSSGSTMPPRMRNVVLFMVPGSLRLQLPGNAQREATTTLSSTSLSPVRTYHSQRDPSGSVSQVSVLVE